MNQDQALAALVGLLPPSPADPLWWLSFADPDLPEGSQFLGVLIIQGPSLEAVITRSHVLELNPGGQIAAQGPIPAKYIATEWRDRLLSKEEAESVPEPAELTGR
jgi:hypothetical protein